MNTLSHEMERGFLTGSLGLSGTMPEVAKKFKVSKRTLTRTLKKEGSRFTEIRNKCRMEIAKVLMKQCDSTIVDISKKVGFRSDISLNRIFEKYEGVSTSKYLVNNKLIHARS